MPGESYQDGSLNGIYAQRYNAARVVQEAEFQVNTYTTVDQTDPSIAIDNNGDFVIAWQSDGQDGDGHGIFAQRYQPPSASCDPPGNLLAANLMDNSADLSWDAEPIAVSYDIKYRVSGTSVWTIINSLTNSLTLTNLFSGTNYEWKVKAICAADGSNSSAFTTTETFSTTGAIACPVPTGLVSSGATDTTIDLDWDNEPAAVTYELKYRELNTTPWTVVSVGTNSTTLTGLTASTSYQWRLKSVWMGPLYLLTPPP